MARRVRSRLFLARAASWVLLLTAVMAPLAFVVDTALMWQSGASAGDALVIGAVAAALGSLFSILFALPLFGLAETVGLVAGLPSRARHLWPLPLALAALAVPAWCLDSGVPGRRAGLVFGAVAGGLLVTGLLAYARGRLARVVALLLAVAPLALDILTPRFSYRDLHELAALLAVCALVAALMPFRRWLARTPTAELRLAVVIVMAGAIAVTSTVTRLQPGWRARAVAHARYMPRMARAFRTLFDFDHDGYSPVAWGGDCDDFDAARNPLAHEDEVGRDMNCNGAVLSAHPSDADRGLAPPAGNPDLPRDAIELALLVSVDCLASDAFTPTVMPRLTEYARRGVVFTRLYAAGSRTHLTLPLLQRTSTDTLPITTELAGAGVLSTAVLGYYDHDMREIVAGFAVDNLQTYEKPFNPQITLALTSIEGEADATAITNRALQDLRQHAGQRHYLWLHYFDTHWPYKPRPATERISAPPGMPRDMGDFLTEAHHVDAEVGRLLDALDAAGTLRRAVVIVTADHGEGFGRHGIRYHGTSEYEMLVHVPGMLLAPGLQPGRYDGLASHRDVVPTLLGSFGLAAKVPSAERFGRSWLRLRDAPQAPLHRFVVTRSSRAVDLSGFVTPMAAIVDERYKLIVTFEDNLTELYDLRTDPEEQHDLAAKVHVPELRRQLEVFRDLDRYP